MTKNLISLPDAPYLYTRHAKLGELAGALNAVQCDFSGIVAPSAANNNADSRAGFLDFMERNLKCALVAVQTLRGTDFLETFEPGEHNLNTIPPADAPNSEQP